MKQIFQEFVRHCKFCHSYEMQNYRVKHTIKSGWLSYLKFEGLTIIQSLLMIIISKVYQGSDDIFEFFLFQLILGMIAFGINKVIQMFIQEMDRKSYYMNLTIIIHCTLVQTFYAFWVIGSKLSQYQQQVYFSIVTVTCIKFMFLQTQIRLQLITFIIYILLAVEQAVMNNSLESFIQLSIYFSIQISINFGDSLNIQMCKLLYQKKRVFEQVPYAFCILNRDLDFLQYVNKQMNQILNINRPSNKNESLKDDLSLHAKPNILFIMRFIESLTVCQEDIDKWIPEDKQLNFNTKENTICLKEFINKIIPKIDIKNLYIIKCIYTQNNFDQEQTNSSLIQITIKLDIEYENSQGIMIGFKDITNDFQSLYYEKMNQFKSRVIKSISHELRTRLNIIQNMIDMILQNHLKQISLEVEQILQATLNNCRIQSHIIGSIIDYHLYHENQLTSNFKIIQLDSIFIDIIALFKKEAELKKLGIVFINKIKKQLDVYIDEERLYNALVNVLSNAIKFSAQGGEIQIIISLNEENHGEFKSEKSQSIYQNSENILLSQRQIRGKNKKVNSFVQFSATRVKKIQKVPIKNLGTTTDNIIVSVRDNGIGIEQDKLKLIEQIIENDQLELIQNDDSSEGFMMGIRIITQIMKFLNRSQEISVEFKSEKNIGTEVVLKFKNLRIKGMDDCDVNINEESMVQVQNINQSSQIYSRSNYEYVEEQEQQEFLPSKQCKCDNIVMLVDDEPYNLIVLESMFKKQNILSVKCNNGLECVNIIREKITDNHPYDCPIFKAILMDYQMPILNGTQATKQILELCDQYNIKPIKIFGCTGFQAQQDQDQMLQSGMLEVFLKPLNPKIIRNLIDRIDNGEFD